MWEVSFFYTSFMAKRITSQLVTVAACLCAAAVLVPQSSAFGVGSVCLSQVTSSMRCTHAKEINSFGLKMQLSASRGGGKKKGPAKKRPAVVVNDNAADNWEAGTEGGEIKDINGNLLDEGDSVVVTQVFLSSPLTRSLWACIFVCSGSRTRASCSCSRSASVALHPCQWAH